MTFDEEREQNWAGTHVYGASRIIHPATTADLQEVVARERRARALGTRHSFNDVADGPTDGVLIDMTGLPDDIEIDASAGSATVASGTRYAVLADALEARGLALHNMGSLPHISVGGATATGTHGSGSALGSLSTAVRALEIVGADGSLRTVRHGDPEFDGSVIALGALGVVTRVTVAARPTFRARQDLYAGLPWSALEGGGLQRIMALGRSVSLFTDWHDRLDVWLKSEVPDGADDVDVPGDIEGAGRLHVMQFDDAADQSDNRTPIDGSVGPWLTRIPHFRIDRTPSNGDEIQTEYFVDLDVAAAALTAVRVLAGRISEHLLVTELRTVAGDGLWLSETRGRDSLCIHFTWANHPDGVRGLLPAIEAALAPFEPRPHWGKVSTMAPGAVADRYARFADFRELVGRVDPAGKFRGPYLDRLLGV